MRSRAIRTVSVVCNHSRHVPDFAPDIYNHFAAPGYARVAADVGELIAREIVFPAFQHSIFTTTEIDFCTVLAPQNKNLDAAFDTFELLTVLGFWNHKAGGGIQFTDGDGVMELVPGATVAIPSGTKGYRLLPIASHEKRYVFRQYSHAGVLRWMRKGGRSDREFDRDASEDDTLAWDEMRTKRGHTSIKMFSKLRDIFVV
jgi:hypothetical protein